MSTTTEERIDWRNLPPVTEPLRPDEDPEAAGARAFVPREDWVPSQTFLRQHDRCDRSAYLYMKYRGGAGGHELNRGGLFHETIDRCLRWLMERQSEVTYGGGDFAGDFVPGIEERDIQAMATVPPEVGREFLFEVMAENAHMQVPQHERDALRYMVDHWCRGTVFPNTIIGVETTFTVEVEGFRVLARADLVEDLGGGVCGITDWKTAFPPDSEEFTRQAYDREGRPRWAGNYQLNMLAVLAHFGVASDGLPLGDFQRYRLTLGFPRELKPEGIVRRIIEVDSLQLEAYREDLALQLRRLREVNLGEQRWQATPGNHCRECTAETECPLPPHLRAESEGARLDSIEGLEKAAVAVERMGARSRTLKARVKKSALLMEEENPGILTLPNGDRGVMCGKDIAFVFIPTEWETITDKAAYELHAQDVAAGVCPPEFERFRKLSQGTEFDKRKVQR